MHFSALTLDDLIHDVLTELIKRSFDVKSTRGISSEIIGALLYLENPRTRLSRTETKGKPFSALGEFLWYLSGTKSVEFISYYIGEYRKYSEDDGTIYGGYGPRLFNMRGNDQIENVFKLLEKKSSSRRAVIQLYNAEDIADEYEDIPCTCTLQFINREKRLHMFTSMRSNDAFWGLPHDIFAFTMRQEVMARSLSIEIGTYSHAVGSLHLYENMSENAKRYLDEGYQPTNISMPEMPHGDPWPSISMMLEAESQIRSNKEISISDFKLDSYWSDLSRLIQIHSFFKHRNFEEIISMKNEMASHVYDIYINQKLQAYQE